METKLKNALIVILTMLSTTLLLHEMGFTEPTHVHISKSEVNHLREVNKAYGDLIHRIWIDKPDYIEDVLCETDEFVVLDSLLGGHKYWNDVFKFRNSQDSLDYELNRLYDKFVPDHVANPAPQDKGADLVDPIYLVQ